MDEVFATIQGQRQFLWRAVDQDGDVIDILVRSRRDRRAAKRFFRKLLKNNGDGQNIRLVETPADNRLLRREGLINDASQVFVKLSYLVRF